MLKITNFVRTKKSTINTNIFTNSSVTKVK